MLFALIVAAIAAIFTGLLSRVKRFGMGIQIAAGIISFGFAAWVLIIICLSAVMGFLS